MTAWTHDASLTMEKNPFYWDREQIVLNRIEVGYITADNRTRLNLFRDGRIALVRLDGETVRDAANQKLKVRTFVTGGVAFLRFNVNEGRPMSDLKTRKAIQSIFDPQIFVDRIIAVPGYKPARSFFPSWLKGVDQTFQKEYPLAPLPPAASPGKIDREEVSQLVLLTVASPTGMKISEFFQGLLAARLGLDVRIDSQSFKQYLAKSRAGEFDLLLSSWYPDFDDIMTYADLLATGNPNNRGGYSSPEYDRYLDIVKGALSEKERMDAAGQLQRIIQNEAMVLPMAETGSAYVQHARLKGVVRRVLGADPDYTYARVVP
jgi:oligopeptide transport system substrate-binding protein